jgi:hypothetical protein
VIAASVAIGYGEPVYAASWHNISGEVWSDADLAYISANVRTKAGTGNIRVEIDDNVNKGTIQQGMYFSIVDNDQPCSFCWIILPPGERLFHGDNTGVLTVASDVPNGKQFRNRFRRQYTCQESDCRHGFTGREYY